MKKILRAIVKGIYRFYTIIAYRPKLIGKENIPQNTSAILCPNHVHALDSTIIISNTKRKMHVLAKEELFKSRFVRFIAYLFDMHPVKADNKSLEAIKISLKVLKNNELLLMFPEGTRNGMAKGVKPKDGAIKIAIKSNAPIIPIGIQGSFKMFRKVKIKIGEPIYYSEYKEEINNKEVIDELTEKLMKKIVKLRDEIK